MGCIATMSVALCISFPFFAPCDDVLTMLVCATSRLSLHLYMIAYISMHESCLLVCRPCFNTMKLWTPDLNLHFSLLDTPFCLLVCPFTHLLTFLLCLPCLSCLFALGLFHILFPSLLPSLVCWFLVFAFACTHTELRHSLPGASKKGEEASMYIWAKWLGSVNIRV